MGEDQPIGSTQDETKRFLAERDPSEDKILAVLAEKQNNGRGTQGRKWEGTPGNLYLTIAVPMDKIPVMITLLPLQIGVLIAHSLQRYSKHIAVKWPNDVLVEDQKIAGVLIENWLSPSDHSVWLIIGVGVNVVFAPELPSDVRPAVCLNKACDQDVSARQLGTELVHSLLDWMNSGGSKASQETKIVEDWTSLVRFGQFYKIRETGEEVTTLGIHSDGQLRVRGADGRERLLMAEYLH